jgi:hypothetical protein
MLEMKTDPEVPPLPSHITPDLAPQTTPRRVKGDQRRAAS